MKTSPFEGCGVDSGTVGCQSKTVACVGWSCPEPTRQAGCGAKGKATEMGRFNPFGTRGRE